MSARNTGTSSHFSSKTTTSNTAPHQIQPTTTTLTDRRTLSPVRSRSVWFYTRAQLSVSMLSDDAPRGRVINCMSLPLSGGRTLKTRDWKIREWKTWKEIA